MLLKIKYRVLFRELIAWMLIVMWMYVASSKLMEHRKFEMQVRQSPLLSPFSEFISWGIPISELLIAVLLAGRRFRLPALYASFGLMVLFTAYVGRMINVIGDLPCSCGGILETFSWDQHLVFNVVVSCISFAGILASGKTCRKTGNGFKNRGGIYLNQAPLDHSP